MKTITSFASVLLLLAMLPAMAQATELLDDIFYVPANAPMRSLPVLDNDIIDDCVDCNVVISVTNPAPVEISIRGGSGIAPMVQFQAPADFIGTATFTYVYDVNGNPVGTAEVTVFVGIDNELFDDEETAAYEALMNACDAANGELQQTCLIIDGMDDEDAHSAINQIMPRDVASQVESSMEAQRLQLGNLNARLMQIRNGSAQGASVSNLNADLWGENVPLGMMLTQLLSGGAAGDEGSWIDDFGFFISGNFRVGDKNNTQQELGYELDNTGITFGVDKRISPSVVAGVALGYGQSSVDYSFDRGGQDIKNLSLLFYGNYYPAHAWYMDWMLAYAANDYDLERHIRVDTINTTAFGDTSGNQYSLALSSGYDWYQKALQYSVYGRLEYIDTSIDAYSETGGEGLALQMGEQSSNSLEAFMGGRIAYVYSMSFGVLIPSFDIEYVTQLAGNARAIDADFVQSTSDSSAFSIQTDAAGDDYFNVGTSLSATFSSGRSAFVRYEQTLGLENYSSYQLSLGGRVSF
ncbi:MAG: autotransporter outer membrane beta-barrel domain-containing protein [Pseudomonadales bacterium]|nr:autotransporter outer membrane beta-barrel domain-containing protein [Pseudomonadales bacterium]